MNRELKSIIEADEQERGKKEQAEKYLADIQKNIGAMKEEITADALLRAKEQIPEITEKANRSAEITLNNMKDENKIITEKLLNTEKEKKDFWIKEITGRAVYD